MLGRMISEVLFDLDETLLDRTGGLVDFLASQHARSRAFLRDVPLDVFRERFLALDERGRVHKRIVYSRLLAELTPQAGPDRSQGMENHNKSVY